MKILSNEFVQMSDPVAAFYSGPSGYQSGGGKGMSAPARYAIPLWKNVKDKLCDKIPDVASKQCSNQETQVAQGVRSLGERQQLEEGAKLSASKQVRKRKLVAKKRRRLKKLRFTSDDEDEDEYEPKHKRSRSHIGRKLGPRTY